MSRHRESKQSRADRRNSLVLVSAILLFIAAGIGLYLAWDNIVNPSQSDEVIII